MMRKENVHRTAPRKFRVCADLQVDDLLRTGIAKIGMLFNRNIGAQVFENHVDWSWHKFSPGSGELIHLK